MELISRPSLTIAEVEERLRALFQSALNVVLERSHEFPLDPEIDLNSEIDTALQFSAEYRRRLMMRDYSPLLKAEVRQLLQNERGEAPSEVSDEFQFACQGLLRARVEEWRIASAMLSGRFDETAPRDPLFRDMAPTGFPPLPGEEAKAAPPQMVTSPTAAEVVAAFKAAHEGTTWNKKSAADYARVCSVTIDVWGADVPMAEIGTAQVKAVRDVIVKLPPNFAKAAKNANLSAVEAATANQGGPRLHAKTQDKYFTMVRSLLRWAHAEEYIHSIPGAGIKIAGAAAAKSIKGRYPYSAAQLARIFASPMFVGHDKRWRYKPGEFVIRDGMFWVPLIALYSGMRLGEIVQLIAQDVRQEGGVWFFDISKGEEKRVKTESSLRRVPIHSVLRDGGLLNLLEGLKPTQRLFEDIEPGSDGYFSHVFSKTWGRYGRRLEFHTAQTAFHSFRHNFKDAVHAGGASQRVAMALMGHVDKGVHSQYGSAPTLIELSKGVEGVSYPIDLSFLKAP